LAFRARFGHAWPVRPQRRPATGCPAFHRGTTARGGRGGDRKVWSASRAATHLRAGWAESARETGKGVAVSATSFSWLQGALLHSAAVLQTERGAADSARAAMAHGPWCCSPDAYCASLGKPPARAFASAGLAGPGTGGVVGLTAYADVARGELASVPNERARKAGAHLSSAGGGWYGRVLATPIRCDPADPLGALRGPPERRAGGAGVQQPRGCRSYALVKHFLRAPRPSTYERAVSRHHLVSNRGSRTRPEGWCLSID